MEQARAVESDKRRALMSGIGGEVRIAEESSALCRSPEALLSKRDKIKAMLQLSMKQKKNGPEQLFVSINEELAKFYLSE